MESPPTRVQSLRRVFINVEQVKLKVFGHFFPGQFEGNGVAALKELIKGAAISRELAKTTKQPSTRKTPGLGPRNLDAAG